MPQQHPKTTAGHNKPDKRENQEKKRKRKKDRQQKKYKKIKSKNLSSKFAPYEKK